MNPNQTDIPEEPAPAWKPAGAVIRRRTAFLLVLLGATMIIGAAADGPAAPWPRLFASLLIWLVGCLSLFTSSL